MNELAIIFKEISILVEEQTSIIDQIDSNIEQSLVNTKKANDQLKIVLLIRVKKVKNPE